MRRTDLPSPAGLAWRKCDEERRTYRFLTWVFGGGVCVRADRPHVKDRDPVTPIRGASIRGQLRFWWRAVNPRECTTLEELHHAEGEVWGRTDHSSPVVVEVTRQPGRPKEIQVFSYREDGLLRVHDGLKEKEIAYGAFPLQPAKELQRCRDSVGVLFDYGSSEFELRFRFPPEVRADVAAALWGWENFGGLGARTRRGFGAVERTDAPTPRPKATVREPVQLAGHPAVPGVLSPTPDILQQELDKLAERPRIKGVPSLAGARLAFSKVGHDRSFENPIAAWNLALGKLRGLRQGVPLGRNPSAHFSNRPGRSRWPEPDEIRRLTGRSAPIHRQPVVGVPRFPRAAFGLPIVFHFQNDGSNPNRQGDPDFKRLELRPRDISGRRIDRFASPLILRPIRAGHGYRACALVLSSPAPSVELLAEGSKHGPPLHGSPFPVAHQLTPAEGTRMPALWGPGGRVCTDPLARFLEEFAL